MKSFVFHQHHYYSICAVWYNVQWVEDRAVSATITFISLFIGGKQDSLLLIVASKRITIY